jgi:hypothetical protein
VSEKRWLRVLRGGELVGWAFEAETTDVGAKRCIDFAEHTARDRKRLREILSHPRLLRALAGKKKNDIHRLKADDHRRPGESGAECDHHHG